MTLARNQQDQERLIALVREALARLDAGEAVDALALCANDPHLAAPLAEVLGLQEQLPLLQQAALREDPLAGAVLAQRYELGGCLGRGAMGVVYAGLDRELQRAVAVKILDGRLFRDPESERRFQREAEALAAVQHAHVVAVHDRGRTPEGIHFLVMERLDGGTFATLLERIAGGTEPLAAAAELAGAPPGEALWSRQVARWGQDLAAGLAAAHAQGLVHRDVKPSNVFLARPGRAVLLDFGIAARAADERLTATQTTLGTPWYMAPEQVHGGGLAVASPTLDVYGLGATLFHLLTGRPPYEGDAATVLAALPTRDPPLVLDVRPDVPRDLAAIVDRCLARSPAHRYSTAQSLADDLGAFLAHAPVAARPIGRFARRWRAWRRAPAVPIAVAAVGIALLAGAIAWTVLAERSARARSEELADLEARLPSLLAIEGWPDERMLAVLGDEHRTAVAQLDRKLELEPDDLAARLMRGCLWLDLGDEARAQRDLDRIATSGDSAYLRELAQRYRTVQPDAKGVRTVDLAGLPEPVTPHECFVAGFHELRHQHLRGFADRADELLARAAPHYVPARAQRLFSLAARAERAPRDRQPELAQTLYDETVALELEFGRPTARTEAMRGVALLLQKRYRECVPCLERSLQLRPDRHGPHHNLGVAFRRLYRFDEAERHLTRALQMRPFAWNTLLTLAQLATDRERFADAHAFADELAATGVRGEMWRHAELVGNIAVAEALAAGRENLGTRPEAAARAVAAFDAALAVRPTPDLQLRRAFAAALESPDVHRGFAPFAAAMAQDPVNAYALANLAALMPPGALDAAQSKELQALLRTLAKRLADADEGLARRIERDVAAEREREKR